MDLWGTGQRQHSSNDIYDGPPSSCCYTSLHPFSHLLIMATALAMAPLVVRCFLSQDIRGCPNRPDLVDLRDPGLNADRRSENRPGPFAPTEFRTPNARPRDCLVPQDTPPNLGKVG